MDEVILFSDPIQKLKEYLGEYQLLTNNLKGEMDFNSSFEFKRRVKTLDNKTLILLRKIDPIYKSIIENNFYHIELNTLTSILHRISLIESIIEDLNKTVVNYQISY